MDTVKVKEQWLSTYELPDPEFKKEAEAGKFLKEKGCTVFRKQDHWQINSDSMVRTLIGYVVEE